MVPTTAKFAKHKIQITDQKKNTLACLFHLDSINRALVFNWIASNFGSKCSAVQFVSGGPEPNLLPAPANPQLWCLAGKEGSKGSIGRRVAIVFVFYCLLHCTVLKCALYLQMTNQSLICPLTAKNNPQCLLVEGR